MKTKLDLLVLEFGSTNLCSRAITAHQHPYMKLPAIS